MEDEKYATRDTLKEQAAVVTKSRASSPYLSRDISSPLQPDVPRHLFLPEQDKVSRISVMKVDDGQVFTLLLHDLESCPASDCRL